MKQISCYEDSNKCILVDKDLVGKTTKIELRSELEQYPKERDHLQDACLITSLITDFMSYI